MKKNILSILIAASMLASTSAVFADTEDVTLISNEVVEISEDATQAAPFVQFEGTVVNKEDGQIEVTDAAGETVFYNTSKAVFYKIDGTEISVEDIKKDDNLTVFVRSNEPAPLVLPAVYTPAAIVVAVKDYEGSVAASNFTKNPDGDGYINSEKNLVVIPPEDFIENRRMDNDMLVFYSRTTFSLPPQAPASKVVYINEAPEAVEEEEASSVLSDKISEILENASDFSKEDIVKAIGLLMQLLIK